MSTRIASGSPAMSLSSRRTLLICVSSLGGREWCLETEQTSIGVADRHHLGTPMASCERPDDLHGLARSDVIGIRHPQVNLHPYRVVQRLLGDEYRRSVGRTEQAAVVVGLELELETERLPERRGLALVVGLDEQQLDAVGCHASTFTPGPAIGSGGRGTHGEPRPPAPTRTARYRLPDVSLPG